SNFSIDFEGKNYPARQMLADIRSGIAMLKADLATPALPIGNSEQVEIATPVVTVGYPLDLPETPSFGMIAGFDRKYLGRYFSTTAGDTVPITVMRGNEKLTFNVQADFHPAGQRPPLIAAPSMNQTIPLKLESQVERKP